MFVLRKIKDIVKVPPWMFNMDIQEALTQVINKMMANKVILNVGLCIRVHDILETGDANILPGDSYIHVETIFTMIVFRPYIGELIIGKIKSYSKKGIYITLNFFDDIFVPAEYLPEPSLYDEEKQMWKWLYKDDYNGEHEMYMSHDDPIRFVVFNENFKDCSPDEKDLEETQESCYSITGKMNEQGLGLTNWWP
ncbi:POLR3H [Cordylochernes scorpioides]|uniref:POLR3H n=1 Tax=Cordylochernes scorpioides TaxID=51811 RepID=A0ABY6JX18_9ARAC|nr:POLR3H [Cordylochernes scorpioides]